MLRWLGRFLISRYCFAVIIFFVTAWCLSRPQPPGHAPHGQVATFNHGTPVVSPTGKLFACQSDENSIVQVYRANDQQLLATFERPTSPPDPSFEPESLWSPRGFSSDGRYLVSIVCWSILDSPVSTVEPF